jgi:hypothetical protein
MFFPAAIIRDPYDPGKVARCIWGPPAAFASARNWAFDEGPGRVD